MSEVIHLSVAAILCIVFYEIGRCAERAKNCQAVGIARSLARPCRSARSLLTAVA